MDIWSLNEPNLNNKSRAKYQIDCFQKAAGCITDRKMVISTLVTKIEFKLFSCLSLDRESAIYSYQN